MMPHMHPDTKEVTEAAILSLGGIDLLPQPALNFLGHHVELVNGGDVLLTLGLWRLKHRVVGGGLKSTIVMVLLLANNRT